MKFPWLTDQHPRSRSMRVGLGRWMPSSSAARRWFPPLRSIAVRISRTWHHWHHDHWD
jgi:hypothetical protein